MARLTEAQRAELEVLRLSYQAELPGRVGAILERAASLETVPPDRAALEGLYELVHRLAGSAAVYGFAGVSRAALELEQAVADALETGAVEARCREMAGLGRVLGEALRQDQPRTRAED